MSHDEPSTEYGSAAIDPAEAMKQNMRGLFSMHSRNGLLPKLLAYVFPVSDACAASLSVL